MKRMTEVKGVTANPVDGGKLPLVGDVRVRVDLTKIGLAFGAAAISARGNRREYLGGAVVVEAFNVREVEPTKPAGGES